MLSQSELEKINSTLNKINWNISASEIIDTYGTIVNNTEKKINTVIKIVSTKRTFSNTIVAFENLMSDFDEFSEIHILGSASTDPKIRLEANNFDEKISNYATDIIFREDLYNAIQEYLNGNYTTEQKSLSKIDRYLLEKILLDFKRVGHGLPKDKKNRLKEIIKELTKLIIDFNHALNEENTNITFSKDDLIGIPESELASHQKNSNNEFIFDLKYPDYFLIMKFAKNFQTREKMLSKFMNRCFPDNLDRLNKALTLRKEFASILGYKDYASYTQEVKMAKNPKNVINFLNELKIKLEPLVKNDLETYRKLKLEEIGENDNAEIAEADYFYFARINEERSSGIKSDKLKEYFPMEHVLNSMLEFYQTIFHVTFTKLEGFQTWHPEVVTYAVLNKVDNELIGIFYLDLYPREGKFSHYAEFGIRENQKSNEYRKYPVCAMLCNFPRATSEKPSLLPHEEVETLFHEFGHVIHHLLGTSSYRRFSGTSVSVDFVEAPSQILENWVWEPKILKMISSHYKTNKPLPDEMIKALIDSRKVNKPSHYIRQVLLATYDQHIHTKAIEDPQKYFDELHKKIRLIPSIKNSNFVSGFSHLMGGYEASYYGYLWAEVISDDIYETKFSSDPTSEENGLNYRQQILELGGNMDEDTLISNYLGRKFQNNAFLKKLGL